MHVCLRCKKSYQRPDSMNRHLRECGQAAKHFCRFCNKRFKRLEHLKRHNAFAHANQNSDDCMFYWFIVFNDGGLIFHVLVLVVGKHSCKRCGRTYRHRNHLLRHVKHECGKEASFCCHMCPTKFKRNDLLRDHLKKFHKVIVH